MPKKSGQKFTRDDEVKVDSFVPGAPNTKVWVKTWGCSHNSSDSEYMSGLLAQHGFQLVNQPRDAHLWLLNSCTVKNPAEDHFRNEVNKARSEGKKVVAAGCVGQGQPGAEFLKGVSLIGVNQIHRIVEVVEETLKGGVFK